MNQDQVKEKLISLRSCDIDFSVTFTGKKSIRVNGLYKPDTREILLHNKNFQNDNELIYTAIHEFAHHVVYSELGRKEAHTTLFWATLHNLLAEAERKGIYKRETTPEISALVKEVKAIDIEIAKLTSEMGALLMKLQTACKVSGVRYEDVIDRDLQMKKTTAKKATLVSAQEIPSEFGHDAQMAIAALSSSDKKTVAVSKLQSGKSIDQVKQGFKPKPVDHVQQIETEKRRLEKTITMLSTRLDEVNKELEKVVSGAA